jgi:hypothetical protein
MSLLATLLLVVVPPTPPAEQAGAQSMRVRASARASVEILRAERVSSRPNPDGIQRRIRQTPLGSLVEFY